jgi:cysteinyl-tRNA synthetase
LWQIIKDTTLDNKTKCATIHVIDSILDIGLRAPLDEGVRTLGVLEPTDIPEDVQVLIEKREAARIARNWLESDTLREAINLKGYSIEDTPHGPKLTKGDA